MANIQNHITQWELNRKLLSRLDAEFPDWIVTISFYVALHAIDALLEHDKVEGIASHDARNEALKQVNRYKHIYQHYRPLYDLSRRVRYLADPVKWIPFEKIESHVMCGYLYPIENSVIRLANLELKLGPVALTKNH